MTEYIVMVGFWLHAYDSFTIDAADDADAIQKAKAGAIEQMDSRAPPSSIDTDERWEGIIAYVDRLDSTGRQAVAEDVAFDDHRIHARSDEHASALLQEALEVQAEQFETGTDVSGAELVEWFAAWRERVKQIGWEVRVMIRQFLDLCSGHLSPGTWEWLDQQTAEDIVRSPVNGPDVLAGRTRHGWFVYADEEPAPPIPDDLVAVMRVARKQGCEYILFDCDAACIEDELPVLHPEFLDEGGS